MGWRDSYATLLELFPQVDPRLIKGAALEHGNDVGAAAEFILNDVLGSDEGISDNAADTAHPVLNASSEDVEQRGPSSGEEQDVIATDFGNSLQGQDEHLFHYGSSSEAMLRSDSPLQLPGPFIEPDVQMLRSSIPPLGLPVPTSEADVRMLKELFHDDIRDVRSKMKAYELTGESPDEIRDEVLATKEVGDAVVPEVMNKATSGSEVVGSRTAEDDEILFDNLDIFQKFLSAFRKGRTADFNGALAVHKEVVEENKSGGGISGGPSGEANDDSPGSDTELFPPINADGTTSVPTAKLAEGSRAENIARASTEEDETMAELKQRMGQLELIEAMEVQIPEEEFEPHVCEPITSSVSLTQEVDSAASGKVGPEEILFTDMSGQMTLSEFLEEEKVGPGEVRLRDVSGQMTLSEFLAGKPRPTCELQREEVLESRLDEAVLQLQEQKEFFEEAEKQELLPETSTGYHFCLEDEFLGSTEVPEAAQEEEVALDDTIGDSYADKSSSMLSIQTSAISEEMDKADWENVNTSSMIDMNQMEPVDALVEEAKADKEALISSIEEIRVLRLMTDQAEYAARQSRDEAARGGVDVMAKVEEMRKMLSLAREANAVHAGEVFGEKAVLATEARELQYRLAQVHQEKAKAVTALNEIKASLQARIESAVREREAAEQEKATKELLAKEALAKEEALVAKVAQESRDLDAEAEACTKIHEFLIERGSIVDALQGEVAVLREDAESLKKDLESMSLSYSGSHMHPLSRGGSDIYGSINSRMGMYVPPSDSLVQVEDGAVSSGSPSGSVSLSSESGVQKYSDMYGSLNSRLRKLMYVPPSDSLVQVEDGAVSSDSPSGSVSVRSVSGVQKSTSDKKSWSSLPSLLRGLSGSQLSGSQDLNNSNHSSYSSSGSNLLNCIRDALIVGQDEKVPSVGIENSMTNTKYPSSPSSTASPSGAQAERELLKAKMAMFPGEELEMEYSGMHNLDVFRTEKSDEQRAETDEEDWQVLEKASSRSSTSSAGK